MSMLAPTVEHLLNLGTEGHHPAAAIAGVRSCYGTQVAAGGWAQMPGTAPGTPMTRDTLLDLASVTKVACTTTLAMRLNADGLLHLDAPVQNYLPNFRGEGKADVTVEQLLTHTAGLRPWWPLYCETVDRHDAMKTAQALPLVAKPGTVWTYSDIGLILAGCIVEQVTALDLTDAFRLMVAEPLGLSATYGPVPAGQAAASADSDAYEFAMVATGQPYAVPFTTNRFTGWRNHTLRGVANDGNTAHALAGVSGHAGLFGTVDDLLDLGAALFAGDLAPRSTLERFAVGSSVNPEQALGYRRLALDADGERLTVLYHGGFTGTFFAFALERELVLAGGATRLYGTTGSLPDRGAASDFAHLVSAQEIHGVLLCAAQRTLATAT